MCERIVLFLLFFGVLCDDGNTKTTRNARFINFQTTNDDIQIDLDFSIPFVKIPVKRTLDSAFGQSSLFSEFPQVNVNVGALTLGAVIVFASTFALPFLMKSHNSQADGEKYRHHGREADGPQFYGMEVTNFIGDMFMGNPGSSDCALKFICWMSRHYNAVASRNSTTHHFLESVTKNPILTGMFNATSISESVTLGSNGGDCFDSYKKCNISREAMKRITKTLAAIGKISPEDGSVNRL